jgi:xylulokinase
MADPLLLGIDVGTSSVKVVLADQRGNFFATASSSYKYKQTFQGQAEQDPEDWWKAISHATQSLRSAYAEEWKRIACIGVSGQGVAAIPVGADGAPLRDAILWLDTRASAEARELAENYGKEAAAISGKMPAAYNFEPKLLWLQRHDAELWQRTEKVLTTTSFIILRLTGKSVMNYSDAGITLSWDLKRNCWSEELMNRIGIAKEKFCTAVPCPQIIGHVTKEAALATGIPYGIPVVAGGEDTSCAGLAMGVLSEQDVQLSMGTATTINVPFSRPVSDSRLLSFPHVIEGLTLMGGSMVAGGIALDWLQTVLGNLDAGEKLREEWMEKLTLEASAILAGSNGLIFLPYLAGELQPINDGFARGMFFGLSLSTSRAEMFRSVMEGTAFAIEHNLRIVREAGARPSRILAVGGPTRNDLWCQIIADVTGLPLHASDERGGAALGSAILAGIGIDLFRDPLPMQRAHSSERRPFTPDNANHCEYSRIFSIYKDIYPVVKDLFPRLTEGPKTSADGVRSIDVHL